MYDVVRWPLVDPVANTVNFFIWPNATFIQGSRMAARVCCREAGALFSQARARISSNSQSIRALDRFQRRYAATQATRFKLNNGAEIPALGIG